MPIRHLIFLAASLLVALAASWFVGAYEFAPRAWRFVERRHPALEHAAVRTATSAGIPGDIVNIAFVGDQTALLTALHAAQWRPADPITVRSSLRIALDSVRHQSYDTAPVSPLYLFGRVQDLAFERQDGRDPTRRHHVRFWKAQSDDSLGRSLWLGAATYDFAVGLSRTTGQITHHTAMHVDRERDTLVSDLLAGEPLELKWEEGYQSEHAGRNGGGDLFVTDGRLAILSLPP